MLCLFITEGAKSATGLMEWGDIEIALEAFILGNHQTVQSQSMLSMLLLLWNLVSH